MFIPALFIVAPNWKQPMFLIGEWIKKLWDINWK